jgi:hypothetical protein
MRLYAGDYLLNRFAFRIHYKSHPGRSDNTAMNSDDVSGALCRFRDALPQYMAELNAVAEASEPGGDHGGAIRVNIYTHLDWAKASVAMSSYAGRHGLRATHVAKAFVPSACPSFSGRSSS